MATPAYTDLHALLPAITHMPTFGLYPVHRTVPSYARVLLAPDPLVEGKRYCAILKQPPWGGQEMIWDPAYRFEDGMPPTLSTYPNAVSVLGFVSDGTSLYCVSVQTDMG